VLKPCGSIKNIGDHLIPDLSTIMYVKGEGWPTARSTWVVSTPSISSSLCTMQGQEEVITDSNCLAEGGSHQKTQVEFAGSN